MPRFTLPYIALSIGLTEALTGSVQALEEIKPPFGLVWGETATRLERLLRNAKADIKDKRPVQGGLMAWDVDGLVQAGLKRTVFYFRADELAEVELIYSREDWDQRKYDEFMGQVRQAIQRRYGEGTLVVRKTEPVEQVMQTVVGYKWNQNNAAIELYYYSAQNTPHIFRAISVHYKSF
ncbi:MAG TPA: hypothetical protein VFG14_18070 [Chthoniobacteraceae bacterium]|nr:hypothetical protein [Chthoniobacteraceae bacterium]